MDGWKCLQELLYGFNYNQKTEEKVSEDKACKKHVRNTNKVKIAEKEAQNKSAIQVPIVIQRPPFATLFLTCPKCMFNSSQIVG